MNRLNPCEFWLSYFTGVEKQTPWRKLYTPAQQVQMLDELMQWSDRGEEEPKALGADVMCE